MAEGQVSDERRVTTKALGKAGLEDLVHDVELIWGHHDAKRSLWDIWAHVVEHASRLAEGLRRERYDDVQLELAGVVAVAVLARSGAVAAVR